MTTELFAPCSVWVLRGCLALLLGAPALAQSLVNGGVVAGTVAPGEQDTYTFSARRGDWFEMRLVDVSASSFDPRVEVYNPRGALIGTHASADVAVIDTTEVEGGFSTWTPAGTYTVVVSNADPAADQPEAYELHFVLAPGANAGGQLLDGVTVFGEVDLGELDSFTFAMDDGVTVEGTVTALPGSTLVLRVEEIGPSGRSVGIGPTAHFTLTSSPGGIRTLVVSDGSSTATGTGRYSLVFHGVAAPPPLPANVFWPSESPGDPLLLDAGGHSGLGPRIGDAAEPFNVSLDCTGADAPSSYALIVATGHQAAVSTAWGWLYLDGPRLLRKLGQHQRSVETWFPAPAGLPVPNDLALVGTTYTVQGVSGGFAGSQRLTGAITQTIGS